MLIRFNVNKFDQTKSINQNTQDGTMKRIGQRMGEPRLQQATARTSRNYYPGTQHTGNRELETVPKVKIVQIKNVTPAKISKRGKQSYRRWLNKSFNY